MGKANKKRRPPALRTDGIDRLTNEALRQALLDKLTVAELNLLERQIREAVEIATQKAAVEFTQEAYKRQFAVMMRVLRDRFGFGKKRLRRLWDACLEYIHDIDEGLLNTEEMLACLKNEDGIVIRWRVDI